MCTTHDFKTQNLRDDHGSYKNKHTVSTVKQRSSQKNLNYQHKVYKLNKILFLLPASKNNICHQKHTFKKISKKPKNLPQVLCFKTIRQKTYYWTNETNIYYQNNTVPCDLFSLMLLQLMFLIQSCLACVPPPPASIIILSILSSQNSILHSLPFIHLTDSASTNRWSMAFVYSVG